jgi:DNA modification methylase
MPETKIICGDCRAVLKTIRAETINCVVTSPPYWGLRDYGVASQIGLEQSPQAYVQQLVEVFREVRRILRPDGTLWLNLGDSYAGSGRGGNPGDSHQKQRTNYGSLSVRDRRQDSGGLPAKNLIGIPWRVAFGLQDDGWYIRSAIVWAKPNGMPSSQADRCTSSYEMVFMFSKSAAYWSDFDAIKTPPKESTLVRTAQNVQAQAGSHRANAGGKTNGAMKAVGGFAHVVDKQRGDSRRHAGFNERWDKMEKAEQQARPAMMRDVWFISPKGFKGAHFAVMAEEVARRAVLAGCPENGIVLDPFCGAGTTGLVSLQLNRHFVGLEVNPEYAEMAERRIIDSCNPERISKCASGSTLSSMRTVSRSN